MSQLFTLQFPRYHFDQQKEFSIKFSNANFLPFTYDVTNQIVVVDRLSEPHGEEANSEAYKKQRNQWIRSGLQEGVRIIAINNKDLTDESRRDPRAVSRQYVDESIKELQTKSGEIELTFREEILEFDDSISLGLTYNEATRHEVEDQEEETKMSRGHQKSKSDQLLGVQHIITNRQIAASSCSHGHEPSKCRLNYPESCWKPSAQDAKLNNSWISIDLRERRMMTKLRMQGTKDNASYVKSFWIDYSDDGTSWKCHNANNGEIQCTYDTLENNIFGAEDTGGSRDKFAEIPLWPPIHARFIRIRPSDYYHEIAVRFDVYGPSASRLEFARVVKYGDLAIEERHCALSKLKHCTANTRIIQVDCKAVIRRALDAARMSYVGFVETSKNNYLCVFSTADLTSTERTIEELMDIGIGRAMGVAGICPMQFRRPIKQIHQAKEDEDKENEEFQKRHGVTAGFYSSIKSRQIVDQLVDNTTQSAEFTYDYMSMLLVADVIAAMGLGTNSAVIVVASMLVSPIMGPVLALTFGVHLRKFKFAKALAMLGLKNEVWSLLICILVGFIVGLVLICITENEMKNNQWPTLEMSGRGDPAGLATGAIVAFASGVGVALSVVGDYMATVIGVAISASLLPPAVNCGMLWAMSLYAYIWPERGGCCNDNGDIYTANELAIMGTISIVLTIENIILVFLASWMMFCIKDVTLAKERGYDPSRQGVYQSITSFKERYDDIRMRSSNYSLSRSKPSMKHLAIKAESKDYLGRPLDNLTVDTEAKGRTLKKSLLSYNTMRQSGRFAPGGGLQRLTTELDGIMEEEEEDEGFDGDEESEGAETSMRGVNVQKIDTDSSIGGIGEVQPLMLTNVTDPSAVDVVETTDDDDIQ